MARGLRRRARGGSDSDDHDEVALSGWLFADLILGLFIVFLGAVSIRYIALPDPEPEVEEEIAQEGEGDGEGEALICITAMSPLAVEFEVPRNVSREELIRITSERIATEIDLRDDIESDAIFPFAIFWGRPDSDTPDGQRATLGVSRAAQVRGVVVEDLPDRFQNAVTRAYFRGGPSNLVGLELFPQVTVCQ